MFARPRNYLESDPRNRPRPHTFRPPKDNRFITWLGKMTVPGSIRNKLKVVALDITAEDLATLQRLRSERCLLLPSHSGGFEPYIVVELSRRLRADYYYLAAMEAFQRNPVLGWFMQRMGAYSIIRGTADRPSFKMTRQILVEAKRWLVVFPEGQTVWQNDTVIPFQEGVTQLAFKAYEEVAPLDQHASLYCLPMVIKYVYLRNMDKEIAESLTRLEAQLLAPDAPVLPGPTDRLRRISEAVLTANETKHGVQTDAGASLNDRIQRMKECIVRRIEEQLEIIPRADQKLIDRIRACFNTVDRIVGEHEEELPYLERLLEERRQAASELYEDLWRVLQFVAIYEGYVRELMTVERFMDVLCLLEMEVFNERRMWGPRKAIIRVGPPVNLRDYFAAYEADKRATVRTVSLSLEAAVRQMLQDLALAHSTPLPEAADADPNAA